MRMLVLTAIALGAAALVGADQTPAPAPRIEPAAVAPARTPAPPPASLEELDVGALARSRNDLAVQDVFANPAVPAPPPPPPPVVVAPAAPAPAAPPSPPPLPFTYLGRMTKGGKAIVYLQRNQEMVLAQAGATLEDVYLVENISSSAVQFVYLPLQARQQLAIPHSP